MRVNRKVNFFKTFLVVGAGLEPASSTEQQILSLSCIPIPPPNQTLLQIFFWNVLAANIAYWHIQVN